MRKSVSLNNLSEYRHTDDIPKIIAKDEKNKTSSGYVSADDAVPISSSRERKRGYCRESTSCSCLGQVLSFALQVFVFMPMSVLESACKDDEELRAVLGDSIGNPELLRKKVIHAWIDFSVLRGEETMLQMQAACIPLALTGRDLCASAITGSGSLSPRGRSFDECVDDMQCAEELRNVLNEAAASSSRNTSQGSGSGGWSSSEEDEADPMDQDDEDVDGKKNII
ncbi:hypothetical protein Bca52824_087256 [Brassica carinata]|uniref:Uncharacterized protein n=1 Tax=Brassica carinata TaxID=52824 RepID=A0A8X7PBT9_BRACI|nr:hypothetical protein Bca52824_087256 [Brassica carinata]